MGKPRVDAAGGWAAMMYVFKKARKAGGFLKLYSRLRSKNACKTCAVGMGGLKGGMVNESGHFPEVCKKSVQAQAGDMDGVITEEFFANTPLSVLERYTSEQLEGLGRLTFPIIAEPGDTHYRRVSWKEALDKTGNAFQNAPPERVFFYSSGRSGNEAAFLLQLIARAYGTPNIHNCSFYCHQASGVALSKMYGSGTASITLEDLHHTEVVVIAGANPSSNHPRLITQLMHLRRRGGKVIIINPIKELGLLRFRIPSDWRSMLFGTQVSDLYLQPRVGSDISLYKAILKRVIERGGVDHAFTTHYSLGWENVQADVEALDLQKLLDDCGITEAELDATVDILLKANRGIFMWSMGLTHHAHGVNNILAYGNIAMARGWLGKPGSGMMPLRGHSNVQGVGSVGVSPQLKKAFALKMEEIYNIQIPAEPGQDTYASMVAAINGQIDAALLLGGNLFGSNPDQNWAREALRKISHTTSITTKLNEGHLHGRGQTSIVLPCLARDEEPQATTQESMFNFVRLSLGGKPAVKGGMRSEVDIIASIAERILPQERFDWSVMRSHRKLREAISKVVPGFESMKDLDATGKEFQVDGRTFHEYPFATEDGKAHFHVTPIPQEDAAPEFRDFNLMTLRSEGQFNTVVYEEEDLYRGNTRRDVVMMSAADAERLKLREGDPVTVETAAGRMHVVVSIIEISKGSLAMYYPEANVLVPRKLDPESKTPSFKSVPTRILAGFH